MCVSVLKYHQLQAGDFVPDPHPGLCLMDPSWGLRPRPPAIGSRYRARYTAPWRVTRLPSHWLMPQIPPCVFLALNYSLVCSLSIHTSSANTEGPRAHCQLKSCQMLHKYSTDCIWKGFQPVNDLQGHPRSLPLLPFDRPYTISC